MRDFFELLSSKVVLAILVISSLLVDYFAYFGIKRLPKPEGFIEYATYLFDKPGDFYSTFAFVTFASFLTLGAFASLGAFAIFSYETHVFIRIIAGIMSIVALILSIYFGSYFLSLLLVIVVIGIAAYALFSDNNSRTYRRKY